MSATSPDALSRIVETIVESAQPERVVLFGSRATGKASDESDYDFLVVVPQVVNERQISRHIYRALLDKRVGVSVDIIVVSEEKLAQCQDNPCYFYARAIEEGKVVHERAA